MWAGRTLVPSYTAISSVAGNYTAARTTAAINMNDHD
jgi:hypothetical protein